MIRRSLAALSLIPALLLAGTGASAAGPKSGGVYAIEDDLHGASAGGRASGGIYTVTGAVGQAATVKHRVDPYWAGAGFFRFPFPFQRLLIVLPGEAPDLELPGGRAGAPVAQVVNSTFSVLVRASDLVFDQFASGDTIRLFSPFGTIADHAMTAGATTFSNVTLPSTGTFALSAIDLSNFTIPVATSTIRIVAPSPGPPAVSLAVDGATVATLGGRLAGRAVDGSAVAKLVVSLRHVPSGLWLAGWTGAEGFTSAGPVIGTATLTSPNEPRTDWTLALPDAALSDGVSYEAHMRVSNPTGFYADAVATFTFNASGLAFAPDDGQGSAVALPAVSSGCEPVDATLVYTVGPAGLRPGGALAVRVPDGWRAPVSTTSAIPPAPGEVSGFNSAGISTAIAVAPASFSSATLGAGWVVLTVPGGPGFSAGDTITLRVGGLPPLDKRGRGPQTFELRHQAGPGGALRPLASLPSISLNRGTTTYLAFEDESPIALGPAQFSPVMRLRMTDLCGNAKSTTTAQTAHVSVGTPTASGLAFDPTALVFSAATGLPLNTPGTPAPVSFPPGLSESTSFFYLTNSLNIGFELIRASATLPVDVSSLLLGAEAHRAATIAPAPLAFAALSVDTGTLAPAATSAAFVPGGAPAAGFVRLRANAAGIPWEVVISTGGAGSWPALARGAGLTTAGGETFSWTGLDELAAPQRAVAAGAYRVRATLGGGTVADLSRELRVARSAFVAGRLDAASGLALVSARGPSLGAARSVLASATGYFELRGLAPGSRYTLTIATVSASAAGRAVARSTSVADVVATEAGTVLPGTLTLPQAGLLRVAALASRPAPREHFGGVVARDASGEGIAAGALRFAAGSASSDDGARGYGVTASTWTSLYVPAGTYALDLSAAELGLSTRVAASVAAGATADVAVVFARRASLYGELVVPSTGALAVAASVEARRLGASEPERFASAPVAVGASSAPFTLFGLTPGSWTVTARAPGLLPAATTLLVVEDLDLGVSSAPAASLALGAGGVIAGTITVSGDSLGATQCLAPPCAAGTFDAAIEAYDPATHELRSTTARLTASAGASTAAFSVGGLRSGAWVLRASLPGFAGVPSTGTLIFVSTPSAAAADLTVVEQRARLSLDLLLPAWSGGGCRPAGEFGGVGVECSLDGAPAFAASDLASLAGSTSTLHCSSMTVVLPALAPGVYRARAAYAPAGASASAAYSLAAGSTTAGALDLSGSTFPVSGRVALSAVARLSGPGFVVDASSAAGALAAAPSAAYCVLGASDPVVVSALHVELAPEDRTGAGARAARAPSSAAGACASPEPSEGLAVRVAPVSADGSFSFAGVSPGAYRLLAPGELDLDETNGPELADASRVILATGPVGGVVLTLARGSRVSGAIALPPGASGSGAARVALAGERAQLETSARFAPGAGAASFSLAGVPDGRYTLSVEDEGAPRRFAAAARLVTVAGADLSLGTLALSASGGLVGRVAVERVLADGTTSHALLGAEDASAWPAGLSLRAEPLPWRPGAERASPSDASGRPALDASGRFSIPDLSAGVYDLKAEAPGAPGSGAAAVLSASLPGVRVAEGQIVDLGVVVLRAGPSISGRVVDARTGLPAANALVSARPSLRGAFARLGEAARARAGADGRYVLFGLDPSAARFDVTAGGPSVAGADGPLYEAATAFGVDARSTRTVDFSLLSARFAISGRVSAPGGLFTSRATGSPLPGAALLLQRAGREPLDGYAADLETVTAADGSFSVPAATGAFRLTILADGYAPLRLAPVVSTGSVSLGALTPSAAGSVSGAVLAPGGGPVSVSDAEAVFAATADLTDVVPGALTLDASGRSVVGYSVAGLRPQRTYRLVFASGSGGLSMPPEASALVAASTAEARALDVVLRPARPAVHARARRAGPAFALTFDLTRPLRSRKDADDDLAAILSTVSAGGTLLDRRLSADRRRLTAVYAPAVGESSFTVRVLGWSADVDPDSSSLSDPELVVASTAAFYAGVDGAASAVIQNLLGGVVALDGDAGRVTLPRGAFAIDAGSSVVVALQAAPAYVAASAQPAALRAAAAAVPPGTAPMSAFYDVSLSSGLRTSLARPAELTIAYSTAADPSKLNVYWFNPAANAYVLQQDAGGAAPTIDLVNRTVTLRVSHFSTFVLFESAASVIGGADFGGGQLDAFNFPNPFDLRAKTVTKLHPGAGSTTESIRGTMLRLALPPGASGRGAVRIFSTAGERIRTLDLGELAGGRYYYAEWDGRTDGGFDAASGIYIGEVRVGSRSKFVRMALIK